MHTEQAGDLSNRFAFLLSELPGMDDLLGRERGARPKPHPARLGSDPAGAGSLHDQGPLEIGDAGEHGQHHAPGRGGGIGPRFGQRAEASTGFLDALSDFQQVKVERARRSRRVTVTTSPARR